MIRRRARASVGLALATLLVACGTDVDLGGSSDGGALDAAPLDAGRVGEQCAPCASGNECASGICGQFAGDLFCATACSPTSPCATGDTCSSVTTTSGSAAQACVPQSGACTPAVPPAAVDGGALDHCGSLNGPSVASQCKACGKFSNDCQPNGCYGGYWCNEPAHDCQPPPKTCSVDGG